MANSKNILKTIQFVQIPTEIVTNPDISPIEIKVYAAFWACRFMNLDSEVVTTSLIKDYCGNYSKDHIRRVINKISRSGFFKTFIKIKILKAWDLNPGAINEDDRFLVNIYNTENKQELKRNRFTYSDLEPVFAYLSYSKFFKNENANDLAILTGVNDINELLKALIYTDVKDRVKNPIAYLRSGFDKEGKWKYTDFKTRQVNHSEKFTINDNVKFMISLNDLNKLKIQLGSKYKFRGSTDQVSNKAIITRCQKAGRELNIQKLLKDNSIDYEIIQTTNNN